MAGGGLGYTLRLFLPASLTLTVAKPTRGRQHLILVPERWMMNRFPKATFYHAGLGVKTRNTIWQEVAAGNALTIVGTQKALFLPWRNLASITVEEPQLPTHKLWDQYPREDNRRLVRILAEETGADLDEKGSFPSVEMWHRLSSARRNIPLSPRILTLSLNDQRKNFLLPTALVHDLHSWARHKENILILHNQKQSSVAKALKTLRLVRKNILIGTSGLFAAVGDTVFDRVIWMFPEGTLSFPDFRSSERAVIFLGRLQSLLKPRRKVIIVTRQENLVQRSLTGTVKNIYADILVERKKYFYPPFSDMVRLTFREKTKTKARQRAEIARTLLDKKLQAPARALGPYQSLEKDKKPKVHEQHILLFGQIEELVSAYSSLKADVVDVDPERVL